jgi:hypothetical protein
VPLHKTHAPRKGATRALQVFTVKAADVHRLAISGLGNSANPALARLIFDFTRRKIIGARAGRGPLCINCDREFLADTEPPHTYIAAIPFAESAGPAVVSVVCAGCAGKLGDDGALLDAAVKSYRASVFPDAEAVSGGAHDEPPRPRRFSAS